jgi:hypothetical protein
MSTTRATKRPNAKPAPAKARKAPLSNQRAAPEKNSTLQENADGPSRRNKALTNAGKGRVKGVPNAITKSAREIFSAFIEGNAAKVQELWNRVARKSPAKALAIYAKLAEFVIPKLQRTELSGQLNHGVLRLNQNDPVELMGNYQAMIKGDVEIEYFDGPTPEQVYQKIMMGGCERRSEQAPSAAVQPAPSEPTPPQPEGAQDAEFTEPQPEQRRPENVIVLEHTCSLPEHQPIVDSKCGFCRQLWAKERERAEDEALRHQRPPRVVT